MKMHGKTYTVVFAVMLAVPTLATAQVTWNISSFGAKCDARSVNDASVSAGSNVLYTNAGSFTAADVGKQIAVMGAGDVRHQGTSDILLVSLGRATVFSTIAAVHDAHRATLASPAVISGGPLRAVWGADDSGAIQRAIDKSSPGDAINISGLCAIGHGGWRGINISGHDRVTITGNSAVLEVMAEPSQHVSAGGRPVVLGLFGVNGDIISGLDLDGNGVDANLIGIERASAVRIQRNKLHDTGGELANGVFAIGDHGNIYSENTVFRCGRGLWIGNGGKAQDLETNATISYNSIHDNIFSGAGGSLANSTIDHNTITVNGGSCIPVASTPVALFDEVTISNNVCERNKHHGIQSDVFALSGKERADTLAGRDPDALLKAAPRNVKILDNTIAYNGGDGITAVYAQNWTITDNRIFNNCQRPNYRAYGIDVQYAWDIDVEGNQIYDDQPTPTQLIGIFMTANDMLLGLQRVQVRRNIIRNPAWHGIQITRAHSGTSAGIAVEGNQISNSGQYGIVVNPGAEDVHLRNNVVSGSGRADFRADIPVIEGPNTFRTREGRGASDAYRH